MPEGHSTFIYARDHTELFADQTISVSSPQARFDPAEIAKSTFIKAEAAGKHLFYHFKTGKRLHILHIHLGRMGRFKLHEGDTPKPSAGTRLRISSKTQTLDLSGPTACHLVSEEERKAILNRLGPDPLRKDADPEEAWEKISKSKKPIGALLLDQSVISGLGNIFRAEILFRLKINPKTEGRELTRKQFDSIWKESVLLLHQAVKYGWIITTTPDDIGKPLAKAKNADRFYVYRRETCRKCGGKVAVLTLASRDHYYCPACQKPSK